MGIMSLIGLINLVRDEGRMSVQCSEAKTFKKYMGISSKKSSFFSIYCLDPLNTSFCLTLAEIQYTYFIHFKN